MQTERQREQAKYEREAVQPYEFRRTLDQHFALVYLFSGREPGDVEMVLH